MNNSVTEAANDSQHWPASIGELTPHSGSMLLLDRLVHFDAQSLTAELTVKNESPFVRNARVGSWIGIEYMAQTIAAFAGTQARARNEPPKIGFLIGSRHYTCNVSSFAAGCTLRVTVTCQLQDESGLGSFTGEISGDNITASASLAVFQPRNVDQFLSETGA